jgi:hypothetical protein
MSDAIFSIRAIVLSVLLISIIMQQLTIRDKIVQQRMASDRIRALQSELVFARNAIIAHKKMRELLGDDGMCAIKTATSVELLRVDRGDEFPRTPTGIYLDNSVAEAIGSILLDSNNYSHLDADDMPEPQFGLRFRNGELFIDILVCLGGAIEYEPHFDIFAIINDTSGIQRYRGQKCLYSKPLCNILANLKHSR